MRSLSLLLPLGLATAAALSAQVTVPVVVNSGGFSDSGGTPRSGMPFALVIDTGNDGFLDGFYGAFDYTQNDQFLSTAVGLTDDWYVFPTTSSRFTFGGPPLGDGTISSFDVEVPEAYTGRNFAILWLESDASIAAAYGWAEYELFQLGTEGNANSAPPGDWDPGNANLAFVAAIPEPAALGALLGLAALVGRGRRRR